MSGHVCVCVFHTYVPYHMCVLCVFECECAVCGEGVLDVCVCSVFLWMCAVYECECKYVCCVRGRSVSCVWCDVWVWMYAGGVRMLFLWNMSCKCRCFLKYVKRVALHIVVWPASPYFPPAAGVWVRSRFSRKCTFLTSPQPISLQLPISHQQQ